MGKQAGIVSGFFTALVHAVLALLLLFFARGADGPYSSAIVLGGVVMLVCCIGLLVRSHFSSVLLLVLDVLAMVLAVAWCTSAVMAFRTPAPLEGESFGFGQTLEKVGQIFTLVAAASALLLTAWLTRRTVRLERGLRTSSRRRPE